MTERSQEVVDALGLEGARWSKRRWIPVAVIVAVAAVVAAGLYTRSQRAGARGVPRRRPFAWYRVAG